MVIAMGTFTENQYMHQYMHIVEGTTVPSLHPKGLDTHASVQHDHTKVIIKVIIKATTHTPLPTACHIPMQHKAPFL